MSIQYVASSELPTEWAKFTIHGFEDSETGKEHIALTLGDVSDGQPVLGRIHSECLTGDALFSLRCDCGHQLQEALKRISQEGRGIILYLRQMASDDLDEAEATAALISPFVTRALKIIDQIALSEMPEPELTDIPPQMLSGSIRALRSRLS